MFPSAIPEGNRPPAKMSLVGCEAARLRGIMGAA
jgi:hypothetical protein